MDRGFAKEHLFLYVVRLFLTGGGTALLLSIISVHPEFWFLSFFALIPYLWKLKKADFRESILSSLILAICLSFVIFSDDLISGPVTFLFELLTVSAAFCLFGMAVNRLKRHVGYYPVFIATLWLPLEYCLIKYTGTGIFHDPQTVNAGWLARVGSLLGLLTISFFVMLVSSISVLIVEYAARKFFSATLLRRTCRAPNFPVFESIKSTRWWAYLPKMRAPPSARSFLVFKSNLTITKKGG